MKTQRMCNRCVNVPLELIKNHVSLIIFSTVDITLYCIIVLLFVVLLFFFWVFDCDDWFVCFLCILIDLFVFVCRFVKPDYWLPKFSFNQTLNIMRRKWMSCWANLSFNIHFNILYLYLYLTRMMFLVSSVNLMCFVLFFSWRFNGTESTHLSTGFPPARARALSHATTQSVGYLIT